MPIHEHQLADIHNGDFPLIDDIVGKNEKKRHDLLAACPFNALTEVTYFFDDFSILQDAKEAIETIPTTSARIAIVKALIQQDNATEFEASLARLQTKLRAQGITAPVDQASLIAAHQLLHNIVIVDTRHGHGGRHVGALALHIEHAPGNPYTHSLVAAENHPVDHDTLDATRTFLHQCWQSYMTRDAYALMTYHIAQLESQYRHSTTAIDPHRSRELHQLTANVMCISSTTQLSPRQRAAAMLYYLNQHLAIYQSLIPSFPTRRLLKKLPKSYLVVEDSLNTVNDLWIPSITQDEQHKAFIAYALTPGADDLLPEFEGTDEEKHEEAPLAISRLTATTTRAVVELVVRAREAEQQRIARKKIQTATRMQALFRGQRTRRTLARRQRLRDAINTPPHVIDNPIKRRLLMEPEIADHLREDLVTAEHLSQLANLNVLFLQPDCMDILNRITPQLLNDSDIGVLPNGLIMTLNLLIENHGFDAACHQLRRFTEAQWAMLFILSPQLLAPSAFNLLNRFDATTLTPAMASRLTLMVNVMGYPKTCQFIELAHSRAVDLSQLVNIPEDCFHRAGNILILTSLADVITEQSRQCDERVEYYIQALNGCCSFWRHRHKADRLHHYQRRQAALQPFVITAGPAAELVPT